VGIFPFERHAWRVGKPVGGHLSDRQGVIQLQGVTWDCRELLRACGLAVLEFDNLVADQADYFRPYRVKHAASAIIDVSDGYGHWLAEKKRVSRRIRRTLEYRRKLVREVGSLRFDFDSRNPRDLEMLMRWKSAQYRRTGRIDYFARPWMVRLLKDLFEARSDDFAGQLSTLSANGDHIAMCFGLRSHGVLAYWFPAYDPWYARYSPGLLCMLELVRASSEHGMRHVDMGKGDETYKDTLKTQDLWVAEGWAEHTSLPAILRRLQQAPRRHAVEFLLSHPRLRRAAREGLKHAGTLRRAP
jgi:CelD/BcsL family acetyltransferase involved in cellulose biosynthesis